MKRSVLTALLAAGTAAAFAGGIDNKTNLSAGYHRNPSRNTESKRPEAVFYNIAGTGFMADGLYLEAGNQFVFKEYSDEAGGTTYKDTESVFFYPNGDFVWKKGDWALFGGCGMFGGGGKLDYSDGTAATYKMLYGSFYNYLVSSGATTTIASTKADLMAKDHSLSVYSVTFGEIIGASYRINDKVAVSAAGRLLEGNQDLTLTNSYLTALNGSDEVGYEASGIGFGGIFGIHYKPIDTVDLSMQYQTITKLNFEFTSLNGKLASSMLGVEEGDTFHNDLPAVLNVGAGYQLLEPLYVSTSFNYYFNRQADMDNVLSGTSYDYDDSWELGAGADWTITDRVTASTGVMYSKQGSNSTSNNIFSPVLDSITFGTGTEIKVYKELTIAAAGMLYTKYFEKEYQSMDLNKKVFLFSLGATFKPL
jgi:long-chain fatty acid transport protein